MRFSISLALLAAMGVYANNEGILPITQIGDGQIQAPPGGSPTWPITQIGDGQIQAPPPTGAPIASYGQGQGFPSQPAPTVPPAMNPNDQGYNDNYNNNVPIASSRTQWPTTTASPAHGAGSTHTWSLGAVALAAMGLLA